MGDQKDNVLIQKKETESALIEPETANFDTATESLPPPTLQLKAVTENSKEESKEEGTGGEKEDTGAFQFSLAGPPSDQNNDNSKTFGDSTIQGKGIAEPFRMPIVQKKESTTDKSLKPDKPSFKL